MTQEKMSSEVIEIERQEGQEEKQEIQQQQSSASAVVERHYTRPNLENTILTALRNAGRNVDQLTVDDLAPIDEFHTRGREATANLASLLSNNLQPNFHVLDVGSGIGGPSRYLASRFGCRVTGLDLVGEYCRVADSLAKRVKLDNLLTYRQGDATHIPFDDATFDIVWTQHASMNIAYKKRLYSEMYRVLKPGGKLAIYDVFKGSNSSNIDGSSTSIHFPVPWAPDPSISHLISREEARKLLKEVVGFKEVAWEDKTESVIDWIKQMTKRAQTSGPPQIGLHVLVGPQWSNLVKNLLRNLEEGRIAVAQGIFERS
ncbi:MAG TPA: methyltransferase domain-containing protein [Nitrososphaera sp.]|jgi:ubiquinone/menaquinone biosynthesis C-methylase UbiE|nr:methyltransferase domain-containing protein [Nitrososphaera sp.]